MLVKLIFKPHNIFFFSFKKKKKNILFLLHHHSSISSSSLHSLKKTIKNSKKLGNPFFLIPFFLYSFFYYFLLFILFFLNLSFFLKTFQNILHNQVNHFLYFFYIAFLKPSHSTFLYILPNIKNR